MSKAGVSAVSRIVLTNLLFLHGIACSTTNNKNQRMKVFTFLNQKQWVVVTFAFLWTAGSIIRDIKWTRNIPTSYKVTYEGRAYLLPSVNKLLEYSPNALLLFLKEFNQNNRKSLNQPVSRYMRQISDAYYTNNNCLQPAITKCIQDLSDDKWWSEVFISCPILHAEYISHNFLEVLLNLHMYYTNIDATKTKALFAQVYKIDPKLLKDAKALKISELRKKIPPQMMNECITSSSSCSHVSCSKATNILDTELVTTTYKLDLSTFHGNKIYSSTMQKTMNIWVLADAIPRTLVYNYQSDESMEILGLGQYKNDRVRHVFSFGQQWPRISTTMLSKHNGVAVDGYSVIGAVEPFQYKYIDKTSEIASDARSLMIEFEKNLPFKYELVSQQIKNSFSLKAPDVFNPTEKPIKSIFFLKSYLLNRQSMLRLTPLLQNVDTQHLAGCSGRQETQHRRNRTGGIHYYSISGDGFSFVNSALMCKSLSIFRGFFDADVKYDSLLEMKMLYNLIRIIKSKFFLYFDESKSHTENCASLSAFSNEIWESNQGYTTKENIEALDSGLNKLCKSWSADSNFKNFIKKCREFNEKYPTISHEGNKIYGGLEVLFEIIANFEGVDTYHSVVDSLRYIVSREMPKVFNGLSVVGLITIDDNAQLKLTTYVDNTIAENFLWLCMVISLIGSTFLSLSSAFMVYQQGVLTLYDLEGMKRTITGWFDVDPLAVWVRANIFAFLSVLSLGMTSVCWLSMKKESISINGNSPSKRIEIVSESPFGSDNLVQLLAFTNLIWIGELISYFFVKLRLWFSGLNDVETQSNVVLIQPTLRFRYLALPVYFGGLAIKKLVLVDQPVSNILAFSTLCIVCSSIIGLYFHERGYKFQTFWLPYKTCIGKSKRKNSLWLLAQNHVHRNIQMSHYVGKNGELFLDVRECIGLPLVLNISKSCLCIRDIWTGRIYEGYENQIIQLEQRHILKRTCSVGPNVNMINDIPSKVNISTFSVPKLFFGEMK